jgi:hypothetical protein
VRLSASQLDQRACSISSAARSWLHRPRVNDVVFPVGLGFPPNATFDATAQRTPVDCEVGANGRGINEADWLGPSAFDSGKPRERPFVVFVLVLVEPQPAAEADRRWEFWL